MKNVVMLVLFFLAVFAVPAMAANIGDIYVANDSGTVYRLSGSNLSLQATSPVNYGNIGATTYLGVQSTGNVVVARGSWGAFANPDTLARTYNNSIANADPSTRYVNGMAVMSTDQVYITLGNPSGGYGDWQAVENGATLEQDTWLGGISAPVGTFPGNNVAGKIHLDSLNRAAVPMGQLPDYPAYGIWRQGTLSPYTEAYWTSGFASASAVRKSNDQIVVGRPGQHSELWFLNSAANGMEFVGENWFGDSAIRTITAIESLNGGSSNLLAIGTNDGRVAIIDPAISGSAIATYSGLGSILQLVIQSDNDIVARDSAGVITLLHQTGVTFNVMGSISGLGGTYTDMAVQVIPEPVTIVILMGGMALLRLRRS